VASVRHKARSIAEIVKENLGPRAWLAMMAFIWIALIYLIIAFADITAATFVGKTEELEGHFAFNKGGAVAFASTAYLLLSILMGLIQRKWNPPLWLMTVIFVPATLVAVWAGTQFSTLLIMQQSSWAVTIMAYCFVASLLPVWMLLQPRGYLGGFVLYMALAIGLIGIFFGGFSVKQPMVVSSAPIFGMSGSMLPFLFVTIACGACSGFHGLVCSGTTSKQIEKESDCRPVGYGAMLLEAFVALIALATIMIVAPEAAKGVAPGRIYGDGLASFLTVAIGKEAFVFAATFGAMAFSTFVFDTLDVATRLGRYILQELANAHGRTAAAVATGITAAVPALVLVTAGPGGYRTFWTLFGTSNQLLAALTLLGITVWLKRNGKRVWFTFAPMLFLMVITLWSLVGQTMQFTRAIRSARPGTSVIPSVANAAVAVLLFALTVFLVVEATRAVAPRRRAAPPAAAHA